jgi:hypothetical protein
MGLVFGCGDGLTDFKGASSVSLIAWVMFCYGASANTKPLPCLTQKAALWCNPSSLAFLAKQEG